MLLRNYYNWLASTVVSPSESDSSVFGDGHINLKDYNGNIRAIGKEAKNSRLYGYSIYLGQISTISSSAYNSGLAFGSGTTAVSYDDYNLASFITTLSGSSFIYGDAEYSNGKFTCSMSVALTNTGSSSVTINEIGIFRSLPYGNSSTANCLVYREVLSTPFTITAGETVTYTHNFEFTMPTIS